MSENIEFEEILERNIVGRVTPHIYAFTTNTVPNFLKVGDTYRQVDTRLNEWKRHFPDLKKEFEGSAVVNDNVYFRDYSVHHFLEQAKNCVRLKPEQLEKGVYYSSEFFNNATVSDIEEAIVDICKNYTSGSNKYEYYDAKTSIPQILHYKRGENWKLRENQAEVVKNFYKAYKSGRKNLLMYAVMRFGKSFTSLCCAKKMNAKTVLIVSAKADVKGEWKKTVESAGNFEGFEFLTSEDLMQSDIISKLHEANKVAVIFLTLQDLQGKNMKSKHKQLFGTNIDLLIVDETHFGARAYEYGRVLREASQIVESASVIKRDSDDVVDINEFYETVKQLHVNIRMHLSGTPYRILMGSEFEKEDIIAFVQFSDIVREKEKWDARHLDDDSSAKNEWDNPYFGFPQMIRFAFNTNESSRKKLQELQKNGVIYGLSALFEPCSIKLDVENNLHRKFKNENEILDLLKAIDGSEEDSEIFSFLNYSKIKQGQMCRHMVMVLPYCASCDAMEQLIDDHKIEFKNLADYKIINISGVEGSRKYKNPDDVKSEIKKSEEENQKTITLTVNRMLTGSTVEQWDTMLYFKDTSSPQEYDQAIFRLQNPYIRELVSKKDGVSVIKENLKPQTLLVDFDPVRMFRMQEQKSLIYNVNTENSGNNKLKDRLEEELRISPIILMNHNKIHQVEASDILDEISKYNSNRSITDEARDIPVDLNLLKNSNIRAVIESQSEIGYKQGFTYNPVEGAESAIDVDTENLISKYSTESLQDEKSGSNNNEKEDAKIAKIWEKKIQTYCERILFYTMLSPENENSLEDIVKNINNGGNKRIAKNLGIDGTVLREILNAYDPFKLSQLDYKIHNISLLCEDDSLSPIERANRALQKFSRISSSEVRTPYWICKDMVNCIPADRLEQAIKSGGKILDIASKSGEYAIAFYEKLTQEMGLDENIVRNAIYSIPTSPIAYEFTRRFYDIVGLNTDCIAEKFTSYDLLPKNKTQEVDENVIKVLKQDKLFKDINLADIPSKKGKQMHFAAIIGNPPYQESDGGAQASARPLYDKFVNLAQHLVPKFISFIIPTRWYVGGKGLDKFRDKMLSDKRISQLHDFQNPEVVFPDTNNRGGVCYFLSDDEFNSENNSDATIFTYSKNEDEIISNRSLDSLETGIFIRDSIGIAIAEKVIKNIKFESISKVISSRKPFGFDGKIIKSDVFHTDCSGLEKPILCYGKAQVKGYVEEKLIPSHHEWIERYKVFIPRANNIGTELNDDNQNCFVGLPGEICTETYLVAGADLSLTKDKAEILSRYMKTKFARFMHGLTKISQDASKQTYRFVPVPDLSDASPIDWGLSLDEIDEQLFELYGLTDGEKKHVCVSIKDMK